MSKKINLKLVLPQIPDIELLATACIDKMARFLGVARNKTMEAHILTIEAVVNAFEHGSSARGQVYVEFTMSSRELVILVRDQGSGFDPAQVKDPNLEDKMAGSHRRGWGLKILKTMSDECHIESDSNGTRIRLVKNLIEE
ncbi:ATP-binding protein [Calditrichota bacterium GD2]